MTHGLTPGTDALRAALKPGIYSDTTAQIRAQFRAVAIAKRLREAGFMVIRTKLLTDLTDALTDEGPADWSQEGLDQMRRDVAASFPDGACPEWLAAYARQD